MLTQTRLLGLSVSTGRYDEFVRQIVQLPERIYSSYVCFANAHMVVEAYHDSSFNQVVNNATIVTPDGKPISTLLQLTQGLVQQRVCGMDILPDLLREAARTHKSVFLYGNLKEVQELILTRIRQELPSLEVAGAISPPFRRLTADEESEVIHTINASGADLILVSLGCPKQELWMARHKGVIKGCMLGLGQAFNVYAGTEKRSPGWMQRYAMDWFFRLTIEPKRLWRRYLITNTQFLVLSFRELLFGRR